VTAIRAWPWPSRSRCAHDALREPRSSGTQFFATGSIGISLCPKDALDAQSLLRNADAAMYQAKKLGPGRFVVYSPEEQSPVEKLSLSTRLRRAVDEQHWMLQYQPIVDFRAAACAVSRGAAVAGSERRIVAPGEFIPLAEELGLIEAIGEWVIGELARQAVVWREEGVDIELNFNLSPRQLWSAHLAENVLGKLGAAGLQPSTVVVEITESTAMADPDRTQKILSELHAWGLKLAVDDFGTGYSSLSRLKHLPVDVLKIDRSFIHDVDTDQDLASMVKAMIDLAHNLGMTPLAEGVETQGELGFLVRQGCPLAQGYLFARPLAAAEIPLLVRRGKGLIRPSLGLH
jgi:EAL domain-containing protein (putative c-di-GMP-specific phosphodiesterase class I)